MHAHSHSPLSPSSSSQTSTLFFLGFFPRCSSARSYLTDTLICQSRKQPEVLNELVNFLLKKLQLVSSFKQLIGSNRAHKNGPQNFTQCLLELRESKIKESTKTNARVRVKESERDSEKRKERVKGERDSARGQEGERN